MACRTSSALCWDVGEADAVGEIMSTVPAFVDTGMAAKAITNVSAVIPSGVAADRAPTISAKKAHRIPAAGADAADVMGMGMNTTRVAVADIRMTMSTPITAAVAAVVAAAKNMAAGAADCHMPG